MIKVMISVICASEFSPFAHKGWNGISIYIMCISVGTYIHTHIHAHMYLYASTRPRLIRTNYGYICLLPVKNVALDSFLLEDERTDEQTKVLLLKRKIKSLICI